MVSNHDRVAFTLFFSNFIFGCAGSSLLRVDSPSCSEWGLLFTMELRALLVVVSLAVEHGLCCGAAHGIFLDQGSNLCSLHWQEDSSPLDHQGSLAFIFLLQCRYDAGTSCDWGDKSPDTKEDGVGKQS